MGSSTVAGGVEIPTGRNKSAYGGGDARSWALAGGTVGLFGREVPESLPKPPEDPDESQSGLDGLPEQEVAGLAGPLSWLIFLRVARVVIGFWSASQQH